MGTKPSRADTREAKETPSEEVFSFGTIQIAALGRSKSKIACYTPDEREPLSNQT
jgi:hypothetical protein